MNEKRGGSRKVCLTLQERIWQETERRGRLALESKAALETQEGNWGTLGSSEKNSGRVRRGHRYLGREEPMRGGKDAKICELNMKCHLPPIDIGQRKARERRKGANRQNAMPSLHKQRGRTPRGRGVQRPLR